MLLATLVSIQDGSFALSERFMRISISALFDTAIEAAVAYAKAVAVAYAKAAEVEDDNDNRVVLLHVS